MGVDSIMGGTKSRYRIFITALFVASILLAVIPAVSGFTATLVSPVSEGTTLYSGDTISIQISGLNVGDTFTYQLTSADLQIPGNTATLSNVNMPFAFGAGTSTTTLTTTGIAGSATLTVTKKSDSTQVINTGNPITVHNNVYKDNYDISVTGTKSGGAVGIDYKVTGIVSDAGVNPSTLSLTLTNIDSGTLTIAIPDAAPAFSKTFTITLPPTPTPGPTPDAGDSGPSGPAAPEAPAAVQALLAPPGVSPTTVTLDHNQAGQVLADYVVETDPAAGFTSTLDIGLGTTVLSSTGQPVGEVSITPVDPSVVTDITAAQGGVFSFSGLSVECGPSGTQFSGGSATISFSLTAEQWAAALGTVNGNTQAMSIQFYDPAAKSWVEVPTVVDPVTHTVSAQVTHFSMYALFYKPTKEAASTSPKTYGELMSPTPTSTMPAGTPITTPVKSMLAPPSTTETPGLPGIVVIGVVGFVGLFIARKKQ
ncbi:MAG: hypothetical protein ACYDDV_02190 [Methanoregula sp.]